jgi:hypothetical protein
MGGLSLSAADLAALKKMIEDTFEAKLALLVDSLATVEDGQDVKLAPIKRIERTLFRIDGRFQYE